MKELLKGAYDLHIHTSPDVVKRKYTDLETAKRCADAGMAGFAIKSHHFNTGARAAICRELYPELNVIGCLTLNRALGGINPYAIEMAAHLGCKIVWFPTVNSKSEQEFNSRTGRKKSYGAGGNFSIEIPSISIFDEYGKLIPEVYEVLEVISHFDMVMATGHISKEESMALIRAGHEAGLKKMVVTHPEFPATYASAEEQKFYVEKGAYVEHCYHTVWSNGCSHEEIITQIKEIGPGHIYLTSDLGQIDSPDPVAGLLEFIEILMTEGGISKDDIRTMIVDNPSFLVE